MKKKYIKDYVATPKGDYEYKGKYFLSKISCEERKKAAMIQILYGVVCLCLLLGALCIPCKGSETIYIVIPMELTFLCLWPYITGSFALLKSSERMEEKDYDKVYQGPIQALTISLFFYVFSFGGQIIGMWGKSLQEVSGDVYFAMILFLVFVLSMVMWNRQRKIMHFVIEEKRG